MRCLSTFFHKNVEERIKLTLHLFRCCGEPITSLQDLRANTTCTCQLRESVVQINDLDSLLTAVDFHIVVLDGIKRTSCSHERERLHWESAFQRCALSGYGKSDRATLRDDLLQHHIDTILESMRRRSLVYEDLQMVMRFTFVRWAAVARILDPTVLPVRSCQSLEFVER